MSPLSCLHNSHKTQSPASYKIWHSHSSSCVDPGGRLYSKVLLQQSPLAYYFKRRQTHSNGMYHTLLIRCRQMCKPIAPQCWRNSNPPRQAAYHTSKTLCNSKLQPLAVGSHRHTRIDVKPGPLMGIEPTLSSIMILK